jgi:hypothetical protein
LLRLLEFGAPPDLSECPWTFGGEKTIPDKTSRFYQWRTRFSKYDIQFHNMERIYSDGMKSVSDELQKKEKPGNCLAQQ